MFKKVISILLVLLFCLVLLTSCDKNGNDSTTAQSDPCMGDANGDGEVNGKDIMLLRKYFAETEVTLSYGADADGDGDVDGDDLALLRRYMAFYDDESGSSEVILGSEGAMH